MNTATNKLDCRCPYCYTNYDVAMRHDGKRATCNYCKQPFMVAFSIPRTRRRTIPARKSDATPAHYQHVSIPTPYSHIQANTHFVTVASLLALIVTVTVLAFAVVRGGRTAEAPSHADFARTHIQDVPVETTASTDYDHSAES